MNDHAGGTADTAIETVGPPMVRGRLFRKYVVWVVTIVFAALLLDGAFEIWFVYQDHKTSLIRIQGEQAETAATKIGSFVREIQSQIGWTNQLPWSTSALEQRRLEARRLLRQVPAITELTQLDASGQEQVRVSRLAIDVIGGSGAARSQDPIFLEAMARKVYYGPVYFRSESEPYMVLAVAGTSRDAGVSIAEVNLKFIWDVVSQIRVGKNGKAYVVDAAGRLIADPDISLVLRNTDLSHLPQLAARTAAPDTAQDGGPEARDLQGRPVLSAHAAAAPVGWRVFVELPQNEAYAPVYASLLRSALIWLVGLILAILASVVLARKMVRPIQALQTGAARIGTGALGHRIAISTGDELEALGNQFNSMAAQLQQSYATLERKVDERTHQLQLANLAKSRFLAAASHDLRQPLHALGLFVAQLHGNVNAVERTNIIARIDASVTAMNELFNALLDISKLDADVLAPNLTTFPVDHLFKRLETTFAGAAREKALRLRVVSSNAWIRSDFILLERIMINLVSNAVRYTARGGVVVGARRRGGVLRLDVWDSGIGIPEDQRRTIFDEFYQLASAQADRGGGLGLGLAIVDRLCGLLDHRVEVSSTLGRGSRFSVVVPLAEAQTEPVAAPAAINLLQDPFRGRFVVVIDDDALSREGLGGLLASWGCRVVMADSVDTALQRLAERRRSPDLIISDYRLSQARTGIEAIAQLRAVHGTAIPAFLVSGDTAPERLRDAMAGGHRLLHKPVRPMRLRALLGQLLGSDGTTGCEQPTEPVHDPSTHPNAEGSSPAPRP